MSANPNIDLIDLTKISVDLKVELDTLDVVLLVATGGMGYLARHTYRHFAGKADRRIEIQQKNFTDLIAEAESKGAKFLFVRVDPKVNVYAPNGGKVTLLESDDRYAQYKISIGKNKAATKRVPKRTTRVSSP
jgi:hypothetical protein